MSRIGEEYVAATEATEGEAQERAEKLSHEHAGQELFGVFHIRDVAPELRPITVNPWVVLGKRWREL